MNSFEVKTRTSIHYDCEAGVFGLISQGLTEEEAERAIQSGINLFVITCYEHEILHSTLKRLRKENHVAVQSGRSEKNPRIIRL
jgi:hypothetical protein